MFALLDVYRHIISPYMPKSCRYYPSCSEYMRQAIAQQGILKGTARGLQRIARCHPWGGHGVDNVSEDENER